MALLFYPFQHKRSNTDAVRKSMAYSTVACKPNLYVYVLMVASN